MSCGKWLMFRPLAVADSCQAFQSGTLKPGTPLPYLDIGGKNCRIMVHSVLLTSLSYCSRCCIPSFAANPLR